MLPDAELLSPIFDITDDAAVRAAVRHASPDACVHLAALAAPAAAQADPCNAWRVNLQGTLHLAHALADLSPGAVLLFVSSGDAYGRSFVLYGPRLDENAPLNPINTYGATKAAADLALGAMRTADLRIIRVRLFNHTGPGQSDVFVVPSFARKVARVEACLQTSVHVGALEPLRDFLDGCDVCRAYALCLIKTELLPASPILNIASGETQKIGSTLTDLIALSGGRVKIEIDAGRLRPSEIQAASGDARVAERLLSWHPEKPWKQSLADVLQYWRKRLHSAGAQV